jgi:hypothetical protein
MFFPSLHIPRHKAILGFKSLRSDTKHEQNVTTQTMPQTSKQSAQKTWKVVSHAKHKNIMFKNQSSFCINKQN